MPFRAKSWLMMAIVLASIIGANVASGQGLAVLIRPWRPWQSAAVIVRPAYVRSTYWGVPILATDIFPFGEYSLFVPPRVMVVRQPIGHRVTHTSANGYTYEPIYAEDALNERKAISPAIENGKTWRPTGRRSL